MIGYAHTATRPPKPPGLPLELDLYPAPEAFFRRIAARLLDLLLPFVAIGIVVLALMPFVRVMDKDVFITLGTTATLWLLILLIFSRDEPLAGHTIGSWIMRLRLVGRTGEPINWKERMAREYAMLLTWLTLGFGFVRILRHPQQQSFHDQIAGTYVVKGRNPGFMPALIRRARISFIVAVVIMAVYLVSKLPIFQTPITPSTGAPAPAAGTQPQR